jgi:hypothetical protein
MLIKKSTADSSVKKCLEKGEFKCVLKIGHKGSCDLGYAGKGHPAPKVPEIKIPKQDTKDIPVLTPENDILTGLKAHITKINVEQSVHEKEVKQLLDSGKFLDMKKRQAESRAHELKQKLDIELRYRADAEKIYKQELDSLKKEHTKESKLSMEVITGMTEEIKELKKKLG